ncbi:MAG: EF-hand domain-containing protein [Bacteroidota bacterium]
MKISILKLGVSIGVVGLLTSCNLKAQQNQDRERREPPTFEQLLEKMDEDEDGKLSKAEVKGRLKKRFDEVDLDEDGYITAEEFEKAPKPEKRERPNRD